MIEFTDVKVSLSRFLGRSIFGGLDAEAGLMADKYKVGKDVVTVMEPFLPSSLEPVQLRKQF